MFFVRFTQSSDMSDELLFALLRQIRLIGADGRGLRRVHARAGANAPFAIATLQHWHIITYPSLSTCSRCSACGRTCSRASAPSPGYACTTAASRICHSTTPTYWPRRPLRRRSPSRNNGRLPPQRPRPPPVNGPSPRGPVPSSPGMSSPPILSASPCSLSRTACTPATHRRRRMATLAPPRRSRQRSAADAGSAACARRRSRRDANG